MADRSATTLLDGFPGRDGFVFHDSHNQPVHRAAPGLLGLLEARLVIARWKPQSLAWLDGTDHFFNHLFVEFGSDAAFEPVRRELQAIRDVDAPLPARNRFLFQYVEVVTRELERRSVDAAAGVRSGRARMAPPLVTRPPGELSLNGPWRARYRVGPEWVDREMHLPVNWELVPGIDNYAGTMRFTRVVSLAETVAPERASLCFAGVDYFADVWLNGHHLGGHEGYFGPFEFDVSAYLRPGEDNVLRVAVTSPNDPSGPGTHVTSGWHDFSPASAFPNRKTLVKGTLGHHDAKRGGAWSSVTGQDGNTGGIWNEVSLRFRRAVHVAPPGLRVTTLSATPHGTPDTFHVAARAQLRIRNATGRALIARVRVCAAPANFDGPTAELARNVRLNPAENDVVVDGNLAPVCLWEPRDHGFPHLYSVTASVEVDGEVVDTTAVETGFRTLAVSPIGESTGPDGAWVVNGRPVMVRGTNLLPTYWLSEYTPEAVERDFDMLEAAGFNAVLVHNLVAPRAFYERANRGGFMVVQMFPLQWTYEQSYDVVSRITEQVREMAMLLHNEPSIVSYEIHNEPDMRTFEDLDNRIFDFDLHAVLREADPTRWVTTFSSGNHAYPGQFYPLRDDNGFATLPGRFLDEEVHGRRISRHRNMPTEFGIQGMPHVELFRELVSEARVRRVLERIREDPKWVAAGGESAAQAAKTLDEAKQVLGAGSWTRTLKAFDWALFWDLGQLAERIRHLEATPASEPGTDAELLSLRLAVLLLDVLHYGGFKGENFWFGLWRPATTLEDFVDVSQQRQYRLHKDAIEHYLNAGVTGPIVGLFSFMFRDADWQAPTWGVVDAAWVPKKGYRAYLESNHAVRASLPQVLRSPVKLPGDPWFAAVPGDGDRLGDAPWAAAELVVANDTLVARPGATVSVWLEDAAGARLPVAVAEVTVDLPVSGGRVAALNRQGAVALVPDAMAPGTYYLRARLDWRGDVLSTNAYEVVVPDTAPALARTAASRLLDGMPGADGFHYWHAGAVVHRAQPGLRGLLAGWHQAEALGLDLYETVQGEHLFRHLIAELEATPGAGAVRDEIWRIRAEVLSPAVKARNLLRYAELVVHHAEEVVAGGARRARRTPATAATSLPASAVPAVTERPPFEAVGRDVKPSGGRRRKP